MTKADIVNEISRKTGLEKSAVLAIVEKLMEVVKDSMAGGNNVYLRGFGSFVKCSWMWLNNISSQNKIYILIIKT